MPQQHGLGSSSSSSSRSVARLSPLNQSKHTASLLPDLPIHSTDQHRSAEPAPHLRIPTAATTCVSAPSRGCSCSNSNKCLNLVQMQPSSHAWCSTCLLLLLLLPAHGCGGSQPSSCCAFDSLDQTGRAPCNCCADSACTSIPHMCVHAHP